MECVLIERDPMVSSLVRQFSASVAGMVVAAEYRELPEICDPVLENAEVILLEHPAAEDVVELLRRAHAIAPQSCVILLSESRRSDVAIRAIENGAFDYLLRPFSFERLRDTLENVVAYRRFAATVPPEMTQGAIDDRQASAPAIYIVDPLANVILRYAEPVALRGLFKDLERLLKYSWIR